MSPIPVDAALVTERPALALITAYLLMIVGCPRPRAPLTSVALYVIC
jgi:hypothetical protein